MASISFPKIEVDILVEADVKRTESKQKVADAISKLFPSRGELRIENNRVQFISKEIESLSFIRDQFRDRQVRAAARRLLLSGMGDSKETHLLINKQAATVGIAALCDDPRESPLGPIVLTLRSNDLERVIDWIVSGYTHPERE
jgi:predicted RNA binding protein with dsRBD fold (UPF0201 family)